MTTHEYLQNKYGLTLTFQQAAEEINVYWETIRIMCARGKIKTPRAGYKWILTTKALAEYLDGVKIDKNETIEYTKKGHKKIV